MRTGLWVVLGRAAADFRVVKKMLFGCFRLVFFWNKSCKKDAIYLTSGCFGAMIKIPANRRSLLDNRTALVKKKSRQTLGT